MKNRIGTGLLALGLGLLAVQAGAVSSAGTTGEGAGVASEAQQDSQWSQQWGPALGSRAPVIDAPDQSGAPRGLDDLGRANGLLVIFNRSADW